MKDEDDCTSLIRLYLCILIINIIKHGNVCIPHIQLVCGHLFPGSLFLYSDNVNVVN